MFAHTVDTRVGVLGRIAHQRFDLWFLTTRGVRDGVVLGALTYPPMIGLWEATPKSRADWDPQRPHYISERTGKIGESRAPASPQK